MSLSPRHWCHPPFPALVSAYWANPLSIIRPLPGAVFCTRNSKMYYWYLTDTEPLVHICSTSTRHTAIVTEWIGVAHDRHSPQASLSHYPRRHRRRPDHARQLHSAERWHPTAIRQRSRILRNDCHVARRCQGRFRRITAPRLAGLPWQCRQPLLPSDYAWSAACQSLIGPRPTASRWCQWDCEHNHPQVRRRCQPFTGGLTPDTWASGVTAGETALIRGHRCYRCRLMSQPSRWYRRPTRRPGKGACEPRANWTRFQ